VTPSEAAQVLAKAAAFDRRTVGEIDARAWAEVLGHVSLDDALAAVTRHYAGSREWIMPSDVREQVRQIHNDRSPGGGGLAAIAASAAPAVPLRDRSADVQRLVAQVVEALPTTETERSHTRAVARARREHGRPERLPARPKTKPAKDWPPPQTPDVATLATRYLLDRHDPDAVADRLCISRKWCRRTAQRFIEGAA
jgi:hypothetical protein